LSVFIPQAGGLGCN